MTVRALIVAAIVLTFMLPSARAEADKAAEFTHALAVSLDGCSVTSDVTATRGNHSGQYVEWTFWRYSDIVRSDTQTFTARNGQTLVSTTIYAQGTYDYHVDVKVWKAGPGGTPVSVWDAKASGTSSCQK